MDPTTQMHFDERLRAYAQVIDPDAWRTVDENLRPISAFQTRRLMSLKAAQACISLADVERQAYDLAMRDIEARKQPLLRRLYYALKG